MHVLIATIVFLASESSSLRVHHKLSLYQTPEAAMKELDEVRVKLSLEDQASFDKDFDEIVTAKQALDASKDEKEIADLESILAKKEDEFLTKYKLKSSFSWVPYFGKKSPNLRMAAEARAGKAAAEIEKKEEEGPNMTAMVVLGLGILLLLGAGGYYFYDSSLGVPVLAAGGLGFALCAVGAYLLFMRGGPVAAAVANSKAEAPKAPASDAQEK